ncbi:T6SS immunity protein Tli4 family protein [Variovorax humicola]|uniref:T6SS immunity protein Tli4 family protein n=1 Tax=Variovorax humicola TaxID=1769758 RepID=A0ABU8VW35_9BURK
MATIPTERRTHCLGRFLIDLPADFRQISGPALTTEFYYGLDKDFETVYATVEPGLFTPEQFSTRGMARQEELERTINRKTQAPMLLHAEKIANDAVLLRRHDAEFYDNTIQSEVHQLVGQRYVRYQQKSYDEKSSLESINFRNIDPKPAEDRLKQIAAQLRPWNPQSRDSQPGFCFQGVVFDIGQSDEVATFSFGSASIPDVWFTVDYHAVTGQPEEGLFDRMKRPMPAALRGKIEYLGWNTRTVGGMNAEEVLAKATAPVVQHVFRTETRTDKQNFAQPQMSIRLRTGASVMEGDKEIKPEGESSISDAQALKLWSEAIASIRPRPGALPMGMTQMGDLTPRCRFGDVCPRGGYWMKQINHPDYRFNAYHADPHVFHPQLEGTVFRPDSADEPRFQPYTVWTWRRELNESGERSARFKEEAHARMQAQKGREGRGET